MRRKLYSQKFIATAILIALIYASTPFSLPVQKAQAQQALDPADYLSIPIKSMSDAAQKYAHTGISAFGIPVPFTSLDSIMKLAVKQIIEQLQKQVIGWITGGRNGNPMFETNLNQYLNETRDLTGQNFLSDLSGDSTQVCDYLRNNIVSGLSQYFNIPSYTYRQVSNAACQLENTIGRDKVDSFVAGNFQEGGGWDTWSAITQNSNGNAFGAFLTQRDRMNAAINSQESINSEILGWGNGFHSAEDAGGNIQTPGAVIADQINQTLSSDLRQLELSKNFDDIVTALASSLITKVISGNGGLAGSSRDSGSNTSTTGKYVRPQAPKQTETSTSGGATAASLQNVAINGNASQSSTLTDGDGFVHDASVALTGNKNRNPKFGGVSITQNESNPWWQVDLTKLQPIDHIDITPRVDDGFGTDLTGFVVIVSANPITGSGIPTSGPGVWVSPVISPANPRSDITTVTPPEGTMARYVRIALNHNGRLEIAGVQVFAKNTPILTLIGSNPLTVNRNTPFEDPGAVAIDQQEGDISDTIFTTGFVNTSVSGSYVVNYSVTNNSGVSSGIVSRTVIVK